MQLLSLLSPFVAERKPGELFFVGFFYSLIALMISTWVFQEHVGLISLSFVVLGLLPLMYAATKMEEERDVVFDSEKGLLAHHSRTITFFMFLFLGITFAYGAWYVLMPEETVRATFAPQVQTLTKINGASISSSAVFKRIFLNNVKVLTFCLLFSLFYGAGALFILAWNASVLAVAAGNFFRKLVAEYLAAFGYVPLTAKAQIFSISYFRYALHGIPEILSFVIAGLAGGILSFAVINHDVSAQRFEKILFDVADLLLISLILVFFAGLLEVFVTPVLFA